MPEHGVRTRDWLYVRQPTRRKLLFYQCEDPREPTNLVARPEYSKLMDGFDPLIGSHMAATGDNWDLHLEFPPPWFLTHGEAKADPEKELLPRAILLPERPVSIKWNPCAVQGHCFGRVQTTLGNCGSGWFWPVLNIVFLSVRRTVSVTMLSAIPSTTSASPDRFTVRRACSAGGFELAGEISFAPPGLIRPARLAAGCRPEQAVEIASKNVPESIAERLVAGDGAVRSPVLAIGVAVVDEPALEDRLEDRAEGLAHDPVAEGRGPANTMQRFGSRISMVL